MLWLWMRQPGELASAIVNGAPKLCTSQTLFLGLVRGHLAAYPDDVQLAHLRLQARFSDAALSELLLYYYV